MLNSPLHAAPSRRGAVSKGCLVGLALAGGLVLLALIVGGMYAARYNAIVSQKAAVDAAWAKIDSQYKRRADLVPQILATVKGAAAFEQSTLQAVVDARASVGKVSLPEPPDDPAKLQQYIQAQQALKNSLDRLLVVAENYPDLKSSANFRELQVTLEGTENRINAARVDYISAVQEYNRLVTTFPGNIVASMTGKKEMAQLESASEADRAVPKIEFDFGTEPKK